jgi:hypothetical protein
MRHRDAGDHPAANNPEPRYHTAGPPLPTRPMRHLLRMTPEGSPTVSLWDRHAVPKARRWEELHALPFGQSVLCLGREA